MGLAHGETRAALVGRALLVTSRTVGVGGLVEAPERIEDLPVPVTRLYEETSA